MPDVSVAILVSASGARWQDTARLVRASADASALDVEILVLSSGALGESADAARVRPLRVFGLGSGYAKNRALDLAESDVLAFVDASAEVPVGWVPSLYECLRPATVQAVVAPVDTERRAPAGRLTVERVLLQRLLGSGSAPTNLAVRVEAARRLGGFDLVLVDPPPFEPYEDLALVTSLRADGGRVQWCPEMTAKPLGNAHRQAKSPQIRGYQLGRLLRRSRGRLAPVYAYSWIDVPRRGLAQEIRGLVRGARLSGHASPRHPLAAIPPDLATCLQHEVVPLPASPPPKTHLMYATGEDILHLYVNPSARLRRSLDERERIRARTGLAGIPTLYAAVYQEDAVWVLEERAHGITPSPAGVSAWFPIVADFAVRMAGPPGPPLGESSQWQGLVEELPQALPDHDGLRASLRSVSALPARHMHGDFQPKNLLLAGGDVAVIDWEGVWLHGLPGLDLVFLSLLAQSDIPELSIISNLLDGRDPAFGRLSAYLAQVGVSEEMLPSALLTMSAIWSLGEERRLRRSRLVGVRRPFRALLDHVAGRVGAL